ncbi:NAD(P)/FAD-dependent oxidoreductase [Nonomuraea gerenzanensis]|uniref:D-amino acid dehydrogenase small subunit n=1 Tax=Nonomuraea gerenzanensis TaxID=93944 RepID=A0A1M4EMD6_9ACTN|nr:FAD-dependent oxidoreductase [Nonomuraea gerenzanensis]UBU11497.1 FAD-dependent oxidoreductase [Nonomuraea gerenzanensis]SBO99984.1 D-amino acid dehydrogenase small subunit [Nonomuraea gerenzanensis]
MAGNWPRSVIVVGAGIVGLSTAWFLQERGVQVDVVDRAGVAAGASWGNAGWVAPGLAIPLNEPAVLRYGLRSLLDPAAPLYVPARLDPGLWRFLTRFAANSGWRSWTRAARANLPLNEECVEAYEVLARNGVSAPVVDAPITAAFRTSRQAEGLLRELRRLQQVGQHVEHTVLDRDGLAEQVPLAGGELGAGVRIGGQRYVDPGAFVHALGEAVMRRGATLYAFEVDEVRTDDRKAVVRSAKGTMLSADAVVLATGAWLPRLARQWGVRVPVRAGRGYSFTVPVDHPVPGPLYLPDVRVACTPYRGGLRVAGTMEFRDPDAPQVPARLEAIIASVRPLLRGVRWDERTDAWVGPRPITSDGRPLIGRTVAPTVYVAGGHGMWGLAHGPITGRLLAEWITTGKQPEALADFDPLR